MATKKKKPESRPVDDFFRRVTPLIEKYLTPPEAPVGVSISPALNFTLPDPTLYPHQARASAIRDFLEAAKNAHAMNLDDLGADCVAFALNEIENEKKEAHNG